MPKLTLDCPQWLLHFQTQCIAGLGFVKRVACARHLGLVHVGVSLLLVLLCQARRYYQLGVHHGACSEQQPPIGYASLSMGRKQRQQRRSWELIKLLLAKNSHEK